MGQMLPLATPLVDAILSPLPPVRPARAAGARAAPDGVEWRGGSRGSVEALGLDLFDGDRRATAWLAGVGAALRPAADDRGQRRVRASCCS